MTDSLIEPGTVQALATPPLLGAVPAGSELAATGDLAVRLAGSEDDLRACQRLRYQIFYEEMSARPRPEEAAERRDFDRYDPFCDHLMVTVRSAAGLALVGTYRLLRQEIANRHGGFYTAGEYDLAALFAPAHAGLEFLELGRSCVHRDFRTKPVIDLLWRGIGAYVAEHHIDVMFGCASFPGRDPKEHAEALTYLHRQHLAPPEWRGRALPSRFSPMDLLGDGFDARRAFRALPPVVRGYVRAGAYVGDGAVIDEEFGTVDVLIVFPVAQVNERYMARFGQRSD